MDLVMATQSTDNQVTSLPDHPLEQHRQISCTPPPEKMSGMNRAESAPADAIITLSASSHHGADFYERYIAGEERSRHNPLELGTNPQPQEPPGSDQIKDQRQVTIITMRLQEAYRRFV